MGVLRLNNISQGIIAEGALEHSPAFAGMAMNCDGGIYKNGARKTFEEKARVAQIYLLR